MFNNWLNGKVGKKIHDLYSLLISNVWTRSLWPGQAEELEDNYVTNASLWSSFGTNCVFCLFVFRK